MKIEIEIIIKKIILLINAILVFILSKQKINKKQVIAIRYYNEYK
jgi:hypothetical protein